MEKQYSFDGPDGKVTLAELFENRSQLVVYHFMFTPEWEEGCVHCSFWADHYDSVGIHLYRFLQEALTNIGKHAQAHRVRVALAYDSEMLSLSVEDDGAGFDVASTLGAKSQGRIGLIGMQERVDLLNGRLDITSQPGHGTRLLARVPWKASR